MKLKVIFKDGVVPAMSTKLDEKNRRFYIMDDVIDFEMVRQD